MTVNLKIITTLILSTLFVPVSYAQSASPRQIAQVLTTAVNTVNEKAPIMLDEETRLDSVATYANVFIYNNTVINYEVAQLGIEQFDQVIEDTVIGTICTNPQLAPMIDLGVVMVYRYLDKNGDYISEKSLDTATCK
jgi:hypothetical protein